MLNKLLHKSPRFPAKTGHAFFFERALEMGPKEMGTSFFCALWSPVVLRFVMRSRMLPLRTPKRLEEEAFP